MTNRRRGGILVAVMAVSMVDEVVDREDTVTGDLAA